VPYQKVFLFFFGIIFHKVPFIVFPIVHYPLFDKLYGSKINVRFCNKREKFCFQILYIITPNFLYYLEKFFGLSNISGSGRNLTNFRGTNISGDHSIGFEGFDSQVQLQQGNSHGSNPNSSLNLSGCLFLLKVYKELLFHK